MSVATSIGLVSLCGLRAVAVNQRRKIRMIEKAHPQFETFLAWVPEKRMKPNNDVLDCIVSEADLPRGNIILSSFDVGVYDEIDVTELAKTVRRAPL